MFVDRYIRLLESNDCVEQARDLCLELAAKYPDDPRAQLRYCAILLRSHFRSTQQAGRKRVRDDGSDLDDGDDDEGGSTDAADTLRGALLCLMHASPTDPLLLDVVAAVAGDEPLARFGRARDPAMRALNVCSQSASNLNGRSLAGAVDSVLAIGALTARLDHPSCSGDVR